MIQDISPHRFHNEFQNISPGPDDTALLYRGDEILVGEGEELVFPLVRELPGREFRYLFSIDERRFFLAVEPLIRGAAAADDPGSSGAEDGGTPAGLSGPEGEALPAGFHYMNASRRLRRAVPRDLAFAGIVGQHLALWYRGHRICGACGAVMKHSEIERAMVCPSCGVTVYPGISPAVIVAVLHRGKILMTKYAGRSFKNYALIAGFNEIGETIEDTVRREVMEEVGLPVKNLRYYRSQPWPFSSSLLMGFFCELDGDAEDITLDRSELSEGGWFAPEDVPDDAEHVALTAEMMTVFKTHTAAQMEALLAGVPAEKL